MLTLHITTLYIFMFVAFVLGVGVMVFLQFVVNSLSDSPDEDPLDDFKMDCGEEE